MKKINELKNGFLSRNLTMARIALSSGSRFLASKKDLKGKIKDSLSPGIQDLVHEFSMMKGSVMKSGQMLSLFVGELLPQEIKKILSQLESQSYYLDFDKIKKQIPDSWQTELEINPTPFAAASIGQVHKVFDPKNELYYAMKIQYPGIEKAINNDITALKFLFNSIGLIPKTINTDFIFKEVKNMLKQEMNYEEELRLTKLYRNKFSQNREIQIVEPVEEYCNQKVLTTKFIDAYPIRSKEVANLPLEERNKIGKSLMDLYFKEVFKWGLVQTDAHFGNFLITIDKKNKAKLVLLDFGATKEVPLEILKPYQELIKSCVNNQKESFFQSAKALGYYQDKIDEDYFWEYAQMIASPYHEESFDWKNSNLSDEIYKKIPKLLTKIPQGKPVGEALFLDRKVGGIFYILKELNCNFSLKPFVENYFK